MEIITIMAMISLLVVAIAFSPLGIGGGVLYVPIFYYMLDWEMKEAVIGSLTLVLMVSIGSSLAHSKAGHSDNNTANVGRISAIPAAIIGTILSGYLIDILGDIIIKILATIILIFVIERTIKQMRVSVKESYKEIQLSDKKREYMIGTAFAGLSSGMLGIGGGAILVTANRSILQMDTNKAAGTSFLVAATIVPVALLSHIILDGVVGNMIDNIGLLAIIIFPLLVLSSSFLGAKYAIKNIPKNTIIIVFLVAISLSLIRYLIDFVLLY
ncbi:sulfite exporter TauE/SafE family protein [Candidatus Poseidoniaceae archaeon]|nr:sulfite exporter TauE/SafE family protein [Candidatus Poseidoniaceae archaeon]